MLQMLIKDPIINRGILVLTAQMVKVLGGQVESLVERTAELKAATQKSTLPKEWADSLGQIDDLPTDTRLEGDAADPTQDRASPIRPTHPPVPIPAHPSLQNTTFIPSSPSFPRNGNSSTPQQVQTQLSPPAPLRPTTLPLSLGRHLSTTSQPSPTTTNSSTSNVGHNHANNPMSATAPSASAIDDFDDDIMQMDLEEFVGRRKSDQGMIKADNSSTIETANHELEKSTKKVETVDIEEDEDLKEIVESVDAYIDRIESSQLSRGSIHNIDWEPPALDDMEDMFHNDYTLGSQDLIEPPDEDDMDDRNEDDRDSQMEVDGEASPRDFDAFSPDKKKRKLVENEGGDEDEENEFYVNTGTTTTGLQPTDNAEEEDESELMVLSEAEFQTQVDRNAEVR